MNKYDRRGVFVNILDYVKIGIMIYTALFIIMSLYKWNLWNGFLYASGLTVFVLPVLIIEELIGRWKHYSIHKSSLFLELRADGFISEDIGNYKGLKKLVNGGTVRIYYDWNKETKGIFSFGDIVILFYHIPFIDNIQDLNIDNEYIKRFNKQYQINTGFRKRQMIGIDRFVLNLNYYRWTKFEQIKKEIKYCVLLFNQEKIEPLNISNPKVEQFREQGYFLPNIEFFW